MTKIYNSSLTREIADVAKAQTGIDKLPNEIAEKVLAVIDVNPKHARIINITATNSATTTGNSTIYTTPTDRDFYLVSVQMSLIKDATCNITQGVCGLTCTIKGAAASNLVGIPVLTTTAQSETIIKDFPIPILMERGTTIVFAQNAAYGAGLMTKYGSIQGFIVDNSNA